jgi:pilin isopeptide linkage protein
VRNDDGYISFSNIALKEKRTYIYYISQNEGKDEKTTYDKSIYKINVVVEEKNVAKVSYEKDGTPRETLPRFSNYKEIKDISDMENIVEYPINDKKSNEQPNYLLWSTLAIGVLLVIFYIIAHRKKG